MSAKCGDSWAFDGKDPQFLRALKVVIFINISMFVVEMIAGHISQSRALMADALDCFADAITYRTHFLVSNNKEIS